jgi:hypothetical protein
VANTNIFNALDDAIRRQDSAVSGRVLLRLVALHDSLSEHQNALQDIDFDGFFVKLLAACDRPTRLRLARHWCGQDSPPRQALILLALDRDPTLSTFVINSCKSLTENDLLKIAQHGSSPHWLALADRTDLPAIVVDFLMIFADTKTRQRIKTNQNVHWSPPAENLFNRQKNPPISGKNGPRTSRNSGEKAVFPAYPGNRDPLPRRDALVLAVRLALHMPDQPTPSGKLLPALLTKDLARGHHARLLARLAMATHLSAEAVVRYFTATDARYFATILWALDLPQPLFERLFNVKQQAFPVEHIETLKVLSDNPLAVAQAQQALAFLSRSATA